MVDIALQECGGVEGILSVAKLNGFALDGELATAGLVVIDEAIEASVKQLLPLFASKPVVAQNKVVVANGQSLADLSMQEYGSLEGLLSLVKLNGLSFTADPTSGATIAIDLLNIADVSARKYYKDRAMVVNTGYTPVLSAVPANALLNEDGSPLLNEDGSFLLNES